MPQARFRSSKGFSLTEVIIAMELPAGSSLERLPGGALGSTQDTDDNGVDFVVRSVPGPENWLTKATA